MQPFRHTFFKPLQKRIFIMAFMFVAVVIFLTVLFYQAGKFKYEESVMVNILGKQRMLTQMMAKDAADIFYLMQSQQSYTAGTLPGYDEKMAKSRESLLNARKDFKTTLDGIKKGIIVTENRQLEIKFSISREKYLFDIEQTWTEFDRAVMILAESTAINSEVAGAAAFVNNNNMKLLEGSDMAIQAVLEETKGKAYTNMLLSVILLVVALTAVSVSLYNLYKFMVIPLNEIYKGIHEIGITGHGFKSYMPTGNELAPVFAEINGVFRKFNKLIALIENINNNRSFKEILQYIYSTFSAFIPYSYIGIALTRDGGKTLEASYGISDGTIKGLPYSIMGKKYDITDSSLCMVISTGKTRIINDMEEYTRGKRLKEYTIAVMDSGINSSITLPLKVRNKPIGVIFFSSNKKNVYTDEHVEFLEIIANSIAISLDKNIFADDLLYSSVLALAKLAEARDEDTGEHIERMKFYSKTLAQLLYEGSRYSGMITPEYINDIERFSPLHDIGKVGVRDGILLKPGKLTPGEFEEMKYHTVYGAQVLMTAEENMVKSGRSLFRLGIEIAEGHHEKWDGTGYPKGLRGEDIPLSARIVGVADVFDALTSKRPYKEAFNFEDSCKIIMEGGGNHFDPEIVRVFSENIDSIRELYKELSRTSRSGMRYT